MPPREFCGRIQLVRDEFHTVGAAIVANTLKGTGESCIKPAGSGWFLTVFITCAGIETLACA